MASYRDLQIEWSMLCQECTDCWTSQDLQLAAELGKTLLERNRELETSVKQHQNIIEDQAQEIEYLTKQTAALREVNDSRLRIYEQLEVSIQDLEDANHRLLQENVSDKKLIKSLTQNIEALETQCEELKQSLNRRDNENKENYSSGAKRTQVPDVMEGELVKAQRQLQDLKAHEEKDRQKIVTLKEQLSVLVQENMKLEEEIVAMRNHEEELKLMNGQDSIRQDYVCGRCGRKARMDDEEMSVSNSVTSDTHQSSSKIQLWDSPEEDDNPYLTLVQKYEALLKMQGQSYTRCSKSPTSNNCLSLQEELKLSGEFNSFDGKQNTESTKETNGSQQKSFSATSTEFSEAETISSGFADETSNKLTQTDAHFPPGYFLCSVADGDDCKFSIYDNVSPVESRFRKTPEYRQLFHEIFAVLKKAAEAKADGEQLPLIDSSSVALVKPAANVKEHVDTHKTVSSERNIAPVEDDSKGQNSIQEKVCDEQFSESSSITSESKIDITESSSDTTKPNPRSTRDILEYFSSGIRPHKKSSRKNSPAKRSQQTERVESLSAVGSCVARLQASRLPPTGRRRREQRTFDGFSSRDSSHGSTDRGPRRAAPWDFKPQTFASTASQEVAKLKSLEKSYAEVLRLGPQKPRTSSMFVNYQRRGK